MYFFIHLELELPTQLPASNDERYIDRKGIPTDRPGGIPFLSMYVFIHLELELLTQIPASNDETLIYL